MSSFPMPSPEVMSALRQGVVIPAHPLALTKDRRLDERRQRALTRYYLEAGAGGVAVGVHTTQFAIRDPKIGLYEPVLSLAAETMKTCALEGARSLVKVAGVAGETGQAVREAEIAASLGYDLVLVSLGGLGELGNEALIAHLREIARVMPIFGFYLQPSVGGRRLNYAFWREAVEIENLVAIKAAPFNRYDTLDVVRAVADAGKGEEVFLYTGNDDNILLDLLTPYRFGEGSDTVEIRFRGGLLGQWAVWTKRAAEDLEAIRELVQSDDSISADWLCKAQQLTEANAAIFDPSHGFAGCIPGIHEILRRQGLLEGLWTLDSEEALSPGQREAIDRVCALYPGLSDDDFVRENIDRWLR